jgi:hypothetical protein
LDDALIFRRVIDQQTYEQQRDRLREEMAVTEFDLHECALAELDVEGILGFAATVLENAAKPWTHADPMQKLRLQRALFPQGLVFDGSGFEPL